MAPVTTDSGQLARRLERLRALDRRLVMAADLPPPRPRPSFADPFERAERLALGLGGRVETMPSGPAVVVERRVALPVDLEPLRRLPYAVDPARPLISLDTETTGLGSSAGTVAFLIGVGRWVGADFVTSQLLMADHADEPALLEALDARIPADGWLVTYNGRTFDWPLLETRYRMYGRRAPAHAGHLDLLPIARGVWKHRLPDARLASVEAAVAGVRRHEDVPGAMIPDRFFGWLRSGRAELLEDVLDHNREDVVSLGRLLGVMAEVLADPIRRRSEHPGDIAGWPARTIDRAARPKPWPATARPSTRGTRPTGRRAAWNGRRSPQTAPGSCRDSTATRMRRPPGSTWRPAAAAARSGPGSRWPRSASTSGATCTERSRLQSGPGPSSSAGAPSVCPLRAAERDLSRRLRRLRRRASQRRADCGSRPAEGMRRGRRARAAARIRA